MDILEDHYYIKGYAMDACLRRIYDAIEMVPHFSNTVLAIVGITFLLTADDVLRRFQCRAAGEGQVPVFSSMRRWNGTQQKEGCGIAPLLAQHIWEAEAAFPRDCSWAA
jgi:hypothetical protein